MSIWQRGAEPKGNGAVRWFTLRRYGHEAFVQYVSILLPADTP